MTTFALYTDGNSADPRLLALAAQRTDYLQKVLQAYQKGERKSPQMAAMSEGLTEADVDNLSALLRAPEGARRRIHRSAPPSRRPTLQPTTRGVG